MTRMPQTPVDLRFFSSAAARQLVTFHQEGEGCVYVPKDGQGPFGPIVALDEFVGVRHFIGKEMDTAILCDPGTDDYLTGLLAMHRESRLSVKMIIPSFGNVRGEVTYQNALHLVSLTRAFDVVVAPGAQKPLEGPMPPDAAGEHGEDGLGGARPFNNDDIEINKSRVHTAPDGIKLLKDELINRHREGGADMTILSTGAMTDLAVLLSVLERDCPEAIGKIAGLSIMGGGIDTGYWHTNMSAWSEFNIYQDPKAAKIAFELIEKHAIPTLLFPLDLTHQTGVRENHEGMWLKEHAAKSQNPATDMAAQLFKAGSFDVERSADYGFEPEDTTRFMHDANTVTSLDRPDLYGGFRASVTVVVDGERAGQTEVCNRQDGCITVVVQAKAADVVADWQSRLANFAVQPALRRE